MVGGDGKKKESSKTRQIYIKNKNKFPISLSKNGEILPPKKINSVMEVLRLLYIIGNFEVYINFLIFINFQRLENWKLV
jgi:transposase